MDRFPDQRLQDERFQDERFQTERFQTERFQDDRFGPEPTYSIGELAAEVKEIVGGTFRDLWVRGEVQRLRPSQNGHLYFELVEKGAGDRIVGKLDAVLWRTDYQRVRRQLEASGQRLSDGQQVRCWGGLDFYPPAGRMQLVVRDLDPSFTLGDLERRRRETLAALERADLLEKNRRLELPMPSLRLGLVTSDGSAAQRDVLSSLEGSGFAFKLLFVHAAVQGQAAERDVAAALSLLGRASLDGSALDAVLLVRGGGARTDLAAFDSRAVAMAIASCPRPVICGLGHEIDRTVSDLVCHTSVTTPTKAAELVVSHAVSAEARLREVRRGLTAAAERRLLRAEQAMGRGERLARLAHTRLMTQKKRLAEAARRLETLGRRPLARLEPRLDALGDRLVASARRHVERHKQGSEALVGRLAAVARHRLDARRAAVESFARLCHELDPQRLLDRGWSLTFNRDGQLVTAPDQVRSGDLVTSRLRGGDLTSRVEER